MEFLLIFFLVIGLMIGLVLIPFGLPGTLVILGTAFLYALATGFSPLTWTSLLVLLIAVAAAEGAETAAGLIGAKKYGSARGGMAAAVIGGIVGALIGAPFFFGIGAFLGALIGAFTGVIVVELAAGRPFTQAVRSGWGAFLGRMLGTALKIIIALGMVVFCLFKVLA